MSARRPDKPASSDSSDHAPAPRARSPRASGRVTLQDVAAHIGVSAMTVSRALRGGARVDPQLLQSIREAAQEMGYVPDPAARALASQKSNQILMLVPMLSNTLFVELIEAAHAVLFAAGYQAMIGVTHYDREQELQLLQSYLPLRPAGLLVTGFEQSPQAQMLLEQSRVPCVHMMELSDAADVACVGFSQQQAGAAMTAHLLDRGYRRIAFCAGQLDARVMQRASGWRQTLQRAGLYASELEIMWPQPTSMAMGAQLLQATLARDPTVDAIFFCNDDIAQGALLQALRLGLDVPGKLAIAGFNDLPGSDQMIPPLTTIRSPRARIGEESARLLLQLLDGNPPALLRRDLGYELVVRASS
ncbi:MAG: LacI family DNA-binding transcriptional regulator [Comamonas sp.]